jgi:diketogulonate reductase-like aldo/keto reductase
LTTVFQGVETKSDRDDTVIMVKVIVARFELEKTLLKKNMTDQCRWKAQKDRHDHVDLYLGHWRHFGAGLAKASEQL